MAKSKAHYVDRFDLHVTVPEDEFHPTSGSKLPHHCELMMYRLSEKNSELEYTLVDVVNAHTDKDRKNFLLKIARWLGASILSKSTHKPLKWGYAMQMVNHMEEVMSVYETIEKIGVELNMTPTQTIEFMRKKLYQNGEGKKEEN